MMRLQSKLETFERDAPEVGRRYATAFAAAYRKAAEMMEGVGV
jgi:hypothetical protein